MQEIRPLYVGIDLGTTNSTAALFDGSDIAVIRNSQGSVLTPSIVRIDARGNVLAGVRARRYLDVDAANTHSEFKRLMGTANQLNFPASKAVRRPEELSAEVLKSLRRDIADQTGVMPDRAVISVPALFELHQTAATSEAARLAGFERVELIQEPVASAIAAGWTKEGADGPWLVYDLGGGTFDVSLLDTREGMLRIIGHDGDNFLGGRDFDRALVDLVIARLAIDGIAIDRANPEHALTLRRLRFAAEEAKIELSRATEVQICLARLDVSGSCMDVDVRVTKAEYEEAIAPLIDRSLSICARLLAANGLSGGGLARLVLVGGPTMTPCLRTRARAALGVEFGEGLDPMTLVAQGAALFAGTIGIDGRPTVKAAEPVESAGTKAWLQFPAMTSDLTPFVVGKLLDLPCPITAVVIERADGQWQSEPTPCGVDGSFAIMVCLLSRKRSSFKLRGIQADGSSVSLQPAVLSITHGITIGEPPLTRSIGVALADNRVLCYFERGAPLPIRRTFMLRAAETVYPGDPSFALAMPIVQGEFSLAHLCRLVGKLEIPGAALSSVLPVGSEIELMLELDRGGQLRAQARILATDQMFDQVAFLVVAQITPEGIDLALSRLQSRAETLSRNAFLSHSSSDATRLEEVFSRLEDLRCNVDAFRGGDLDAGEQARRGLSDFDALLVDLETEKVWPELAQRLEERIDLYLGWIASHGSDVEKTALSKAYQACKQALAGKVEQVFERQLRLIEELGTAAYYRRPGAWEEQFDEAASRVGESTDLRRATELVAQGREARRQNRQTDLQSIVRELWELQPVNPENQSLGHGSGLIYR